MQLEELKGRQARGIACVAPNPNSPAHPGSTSTDGRPQERPVPAFPGMDCGLVLAGLPAGSVCVGEVRIPLSLTVAPLAHLVLCPHRPPVWFVRLPSKEGLPIWRELSRSEPIRWAIASGLPGTARAAAELLRCANELRAQEVA